MKLFLLFFIIVLWYCPGEFHRQFSTFKPIVSRRTTFVPELLDVTCLLRPDAGPCRANITMFRFDAKNESCVPFSWGGCQGNGNRFDTEQDCLDNCMSKPNPSKKRPNWCSLTFDYGFCFGSVDRWYYDPLWKVCKKTVYSGCGGNKNRFDTMEQCDSVCRLKNGPLEEKAKRNYSADLKQLIINPLDATTKRPTTLTTLTNWGSSTGTTKNTPKPNDNTSNGPHPTPSSDSPKRDRYF